MILNENKSISGKEALTFRSNPTNQLISRGTHMYRFITPYQNWILGSYWLDHDTIERMRFFARNNGCTLSSVARSWSAVKHEWNDKMEYLCEIRLIRDCYAWTGPARFQKRDESPEEKRKRLPENVLWMGNANQIYLPNLTSQEAQIVSFIAN